MDITQFVMAYGVEQDRLSPPAADGGKRRRHPLPPGAGSLLRVLHPAGLNPPARRWVFSLAAAAASWYNVLYYRMDR